MENPTKRKNCPKGSRRNKKTGECDKINKTPMEKSTEKSKEKSTEKSNDLKQDKEKIKKIKNCPRGTRRNKKTGECEKINKIEQGKNKEKSKSKSKSKSNKMKPDWDYNTKKVVKTHNGRVFTFMEISENTFIYRGYQYGSPTGHNPSPGEIEHTEKYNIKAAQKAKSEGLYYGTLGVACYYALNRDRGYMISHEVMEFKPKHKLIILDMSVWQNLKNIADDCGEGTEFEKKYGEDKDSVLEYTHEFYKNDPDKKLERGSTSVDNQMTELMLNWMKLDTSPEMDGFGHSMMPGFHSELTCVSREKNLELLKVYSKNDFFSHELVNEKIKTDVIYLDNLEYMTDGNKSPFKIKELLPSETREEMAERRMNLSHALRR